LYSYKPTCSPLCTANKGNCINDNVCDCSKINRKGINCEEYIKLERNNSIDVTFIVIASLIIFVAMLLIYLIIIYRNQPNIKRGNNKIYYYKIFTNIFLIYI